MGDSAVVNRVLPGFYLDSVALMQLSRRVSAAPGMESAALMIGTETNRDLLEDADLLREPGRAAGPDDLIIAVRAATEAAGEEAVAAALSLLDPRAREQEAGGGYSPKGWRAAVEGLPGANLAFISVPGAFAPAEARRALDRGLHVMIFSDQVPVEEERALKELAAARGLWVLGPDAGSAIIAGARLGFVNVVPRGDAGIVAASGTGLQEVSVQLARAGVGISHAVGVGGRDLSDAVGGIATLAVIDALEADPATARIILVSKPPGERTAARVAARLEACTKPVTVCFIGATGGGGNGLHHATTLAEAAAHAAGIRGEEETRVERPGPAGPRASSRERRWVRGLFSGGTLCAEAQVVLRDAGAGVASNVPVPGAERLAAGRPAGHALLDLGADEFTAGRPHPMIDPEARGPHLAEGLSDPEVAVLLVDVVLGYGAHPDPAGAVAGALGPAAGREVAVVASVCGTDADPQGRAGQVAKLEATGVLIAPSNAAAAALALRIANGD